MSNRVIRSRNRNLKKTNRNQRKSIKRRRLRTMKGGYDTKQYTPNLFSRFGRAIAQKWRSPEKRASHAKYYANKNATRHGKHVILDELRKDTTRGSLSLSDYNKNITKYKSCVDAMYSPLGLDLGLDVTQKQQLEAISVVLDGRKTAITTQIETKSKEYKQDYEDRYGVGSLETALAAALEKAANQGANDDALDGISQNELGNATKKAGKLGSYILMGSALKKAKREYLTADEDYKGSLDKVFNLLKENTACNFKAAEKNALDQIKILLKMVVSGNLNDVGMQLDTLNTSSIAYKLNQESSAYGIEKGVIVAHSTDAHVMLPAGAFSNPMFNHSGYQAAQAAQRSGSMRSTGSHYFDGDGERDRFNSLRSTGSHYVDGAGDPLRTTSLGAVVDYRDGAEVAAEQAEASVYAQPTEYFDGAGAPQRAAARRASMSALGDATADQRGYEYEGDPFFANPRSIGPGGQYDPEIAGGQPSGQQVAAVPGGQEQQQQVAAAQAATTLAEQPRRESSEQIEPAQGQAATEIAGGQDQGVGGGGGGSGGGE
jgi:hypothetical protein